MIPHLILTPSNFSRASQALHEAARPNASLLAIDRGKLGTLYVFCRDASDAAELAKGWRNDQRIPYGYSTIDLAPSGGVLVINQEGTVQSQGRLAAFVTPLLERLRPYRLVDGDSGNDVTESSSDALFRVE
jgi:hypothetical protein